MIYKPKLSLKEEAIINQYSKAWGRSNNINRQYPRSKKSRNIKFDLNKFLEKIPPMKREKIRIARQQKLKERKLLKLAKDEILKTNKMKRMRVIDDLEKGKFRRYIRFRSKILKDNSSILDDLKIDRRISKRSKQNYSMVIQESYNYSRLNSRQGSNSEFIRGAKNSSNRDAIIIKKNYKGPLDNQSIKGMALDERFDTIGNSHKTILPIYQNKRIGFGLVKNRHRYCCITKHNESSRKKGLKQKCYSVPKSRNLRKRINLKRERFHSAVKKIKRKDQLYVKPHIQNTRKYTERKKDNFTLNNDSLTHDQNYYNRFSNNYPKRKKRKKTNQDFKQDNLDKEEKNDTSKEQSLKNMKRLKKAKENKELYQLFPHFQRYDIHEDCKNQQSKIETKRKETKLNKKSDKVIRKNISKKSKQKITHHQIINVILSESNTRSFETLQKDVNPKTYNQINQFDTEINEVISSPRSSKITKIKAKVPSCKIRNKFDFDKKKRNVYRKIKSKNHLGLVKHTCSSLNRDQQNKNTVDDINKKKHNLDCKSFHKCGKLEEVVNFDKGSIDFKMDELKKINLVQINQANQANQAEDTLENESKNILGSMDQINYEKSFEKTSKNLSSYSKMEQEINKLTQGKKMMPHSSLEGNLKSDKTLRGSFLNIKDRISKPSKNLNPKIYSEKDEISSYNSIKDEKILRKIYNEENKKVQSKTVDIFSISSKKIQHKEASDRGHGFPKNKQSNFKIRNQNISRHAHPREIRFSKSERKNISNRVKSLSKIMLKSSVNRRHLYKSMKKTQKKNESLKNVASDVSKSKSKMTNSISINSDSSLLCNSNIENKTNIEMKQDKISVTKKITHADESINKSEKIKTQDSNNMVLLTMNTNKTKKGLIIDQRYRGEHFPQKIITSPKNISVKYIEKIAYNEKITSLQKVVSPTCSMKLDHSFASQTIKIDEKLIDIFDQNSDCNQKVNQPIFKSKNHLTLDSRLDEIKVERIELKINKNRELDSKKIYFIGETERDDLNEPEDCQDKWNPYIDQKTYYKVYKMGDYIKNEKVKIIIDEDGESC